MDRWDGGHGVTGRERGHGGGLNVVSELLLAWVLMRPVVLVVGGWPWAGSSLKLEAAER